MFNKNNWATGLAWPAKRYTGCDQYRDKLSEAKEDVVEIGKAASRNIDWLTRHYLRIANREDAANRRRILGPLSALFGDGIADPLLDGGRAAKAQGMGAESDSTSWELGTLHTVRNNS